MGRAEVGRGSHDGLAGSTVATIRYRPLDALHSLIFKVSGV
jgi:hypothetical protein